MESLQQNQTLPILTSFPAKTFNQEPTTSEPIIISNVVFTEWEEGGLPYLPKLPSVIVPFSSFS